MKKIVITSLLITALTTANASSIPYCKGTTVTPEEDAVIQRLVPQFGTTYGCEVGNNCLLKWNVQGNTEKFSIAWKKQCGPVINGAYQFGDEGHGSTFICTTEANSKSVCCAPLGYERLKEFNICSRDIMK